jgi:tetratricopeptide (TPR) repeat protein
LRDALRIAGAADARRIFAEVSLRLLHAAIVDDRFAEAAHVLPFVEAVVDAAIPSRLAIQLLVDEAAIHANDAAYDDALRVLARAEAHADALGDAARFERIRIVNEIAFTLDARGDAAGAERNFRAALELTRTLLGPRHRSVLKSYGNLVSSLTSLGRHDEAQATLREARSLTAGYPAATAEVINLEAVEAADWQARGNLERALVHFEAALAGYSSSLGPTAPPAIRIHIRIGKCLIALHRAADAVPHFEVWLARKVAEHATADFQAEAGFWLAQALWATPRQRGRAMATAETALARYHEAGTGYTAEAAEIVRWIAGHRGR